MTTETAPLVAAIQPPEIVRETIHAQHKFNIDETLKLKDDLLAAIRNDAQIEAEFASSKAEFKSRIEKADLEREDILRKLTNGFEMRPTRALIQFNVPEHGRKTYVREDNNEVIRDEPMSFADQERPLFKNADGKDATEVIDAGTVNADVVPETAAERERNKAGAEFTNTEGEGTREDLGGILDVPNAGTTPLGDALGSAAAKVELQQIVIPDFEQADWTQSTLVKAFRKAARPVWPETSISTLADILLKAEDVEAAKDSLRPHVVGAARRFREILNEGISIFGEEASETRLRELYAEAVTHYPAKYPGGHSDAGYRAFREDVEEAAAQARETGGSEA